MLGDAFDECTQWNVLWKFLTQVAKSQCPSLRLLFTSRPEREIEDVVSSLGIPSLDLRTVMDEDIEQFITETLEHSARPVCRLPEKAKNLIRESLVRRAGGM
jgi:ERCC4-related helicase